MSGLYDQIRGHCHGLAKYVSQMSQSVSPFLTVWVGGTSLVEPLPLFVEAGAVVGYANVEFGADGVVRRVAGQGEPGRRGMADRARMERDDGRSVGDLTGERRK